MLLLVAAVLMTLGIGADFREYNADRSAHVAVVADDQEFIDLTPNQPYAYIGEDGKLYIDFSENNPNYQNESLNPGWWGKGVSPSSEYAFDCVFNVSNDLWDNVRINVTITVDGEGMSIYTTDPDDAHSRVNFILDPGDEQCVGILISAASNDYPCTWFNGTIKLTAEPWGELTGPWGR